MRYRVTERQKQAGREIDTEEREHLQNQRSVVTRLLLQQLTEKIDGGVIVALTDDRSECGETERERKRETNRNKMSDNNMVASSLEGSMLRIDTH